ncbi:MAG: hypothetical protein JO041_16020 [Acidobacteria bacterium]|nr:hypothetical protein [Acidobacteriota bacterium]
MNLSISMMLLEFTRLVLGLSVAAFHKPIADFILEHERSLVVLLRQRGLMVPAAPTRNTAHNMYFGIGMGIAAIELIRIYMLHRGLL